MTLDWFRSWHGAPTDNKWLLIGKKAGVAPGIVSAIAWALMDHASQNKDRGSIDGFDAETYSAFSGFDEDQIEAVITALKDKGMISDNRLVSWEKRQPNREDDSAAERKRKQRDREKQAQSDDVSHNVTQCHKKSRLDKIQITDTEKKESPLTPQGGGVSVSHETKTEQKKSGITGAMGAADADIEAFNAAYPRKTGIGAARSQFTNEIMFKNADPAQMIRAAKAFAGKCEKDGTEERFIPKPAKWLSDQCYLDPDLQDDGPKAIAIADMKPWQRAIADQIGAAPTAAWFRDAIWDEPILMMPSKFSADHVSQHYLPQLRRALGAMIIITERKESVA